MSDLKNFMQNVSSIQKVLPNGTIIWRKSVILDGSGNPVPLSLFYRIVNSPERTVMRDNVCHTRFEKTQKERKLIKAYKSDYKKGMKALFNGNPNWKKVAKNLKVHNVPDDSKVIGEIQKQLA